MKAGIIVTVFGLCALAACTHHSHDNDGGSSDLAGVDAGNVDQHASMPDLLPDGALDEGFDAGPQAITVYGTTPATYVVQYGDPSADSETLEVAYNFSGGPAPMAYTIFVHFLDANGNDQTTKKDFTPPVPTNEWDGTMRTYYRNTQIPFSLDKTTTTFLPGVYKIAIGLYVGTSLLPMTAGMGATDLGGGAYQVGTLIVTSLDGAVITASTDALTDGSGVAWTLTGGVVSRAGKVIANTSGVTSLLFLNGTIYASVGSSWQACTATACTSVAGDPRVFGLSAKPTGVVPKNVSAKMTDCVNIHDVGDANAIMTAAAAGFSCVRADLRWADIEPTTEGTYTFNSSGFDYDALMTTLSNLHMKALFTVDYGNRLYTMGDAAVDPPITAPALAGWKSFVAAIATHFKSQDANILAYEIWNEENGGFWPPVANPSQYAALLATALEGIRSVDPNVAVVSGGTYSIDIGFAEQFITPSMVEKSGQAIGIHPYRANAPESALSQIALAQGVFAPFPTWITEWGYSSSWYLQAMNPKNATNDGTQPAAQLFQARNDVRMLITEWLSGVPFEVLYELSDGTMVDGTDAEDNFGLIDANGVNKPAYAAVKTMHDQLASYAFAGIVTTNVSTLDALRFDGADTLYVAWLDAPNATATLTLPVNATGVDMRGNALTFTTTAGGATYALTEALGPVYLHLP